MFKRLHSSIWSLWGINAGFYMGNALYFTYMPVYMRSIGIDNGVVGLLSGLPLLLSMFIQPTFGLIADRAKSKNRVLLFTLLTMATVMAVFPLNQSIIWVAFLAVCYMCLQASAMPLIDAIAFESGARYGYNYGAVRLAGTFGGMMSMLFGGMLMDISNSIIFPMYVVLSIVAMIGTCKAPKIQGHQHEGNKVSFMPLLKNKKLVVMAVPVFLIFVYWGCYTTFYGIFLKGLGVSNTVFAVAMFLSAVPEVPVLLFTNRIYRKVGPYWFLVAGSVCAIVRCLLCAFTTNIPIFLIAQVLCGATFILIYTPLSTYYNENAPMELKASSLMLFAIIMNLGRMAGSVGGGFLSDGGLALSTIFFIMAVIVTVALMWVAVLMIRSRKELKAVQGERTI